MRESRLLDALFPRTRQMILSATLADPQRLWYLSDLAKHLHVRPSTLQRELASLERAGILRRSRDGGRVYYQPDPACPVLIELRGLVLKTIALVDVLREALLPWSGAIDCAFIYGSVARNDESSGSDVDLMLIGAVGLSELARALREAERGLGRQVTTAIYTRQEFSAKLASRNHFLEAVLSDARLFILGDENGLADLVGGAAVRPHITSKQEIDELRALVERDLRDAELTGLSADRRFATAYNAALQLAKMVAACAGFRVVGPGHHQTTFEALEAAIGNEGTSYAAYFESCRRKRNFLEYDAANVVADTEANEIAENARAMRKDVEDWIARNYPALTP